MNLSQLPEQDRPREKLLRRGASQLSDAELLAILLQSGLPGQSALQLAHQALAHFGSVRGLCSASAARFCAIKGLGRVRFVLCQAMVELGRRYFYEALSRELTLSNVGDTRRFLVSQLRDEARERFAVLALDSQHRMIAFDILFSGTINAASVYPRVVAQHALEKQAAALVLAHNHPSGVAEPSPADKQITRTLCDALALLDIAVLDHFIVAGDSAFSFAESGLL